MKRYVANDYTDKRRPTIGADFMTKEIVAGDQPMLLQVRQGSEASFTSVRAQCIDGRLDTEGAEWLS